MRPYFLPCLLVAVFAAGNAGCGRPATNSASHEGSGTKPAQGYLADQAAREDGETPTARKSTFETSLVDEEPAARKKPVERKIIYTANLQIVVKDLDEARTQLSGLIKRHNAYVASSNISGESGTRRSGNWTVRLPVGEFEAFRDGLLETGYPRENSLSSDDVTDRFYDLERRIANEKSTEKRLLQLLEDRTSNLKDVLALEEKLGSVRGNIEVMEGRLRMWKNLTALTTVSLTFIEDAKYTPPQEPAFTTTIGKTFDSSVSAMAEFGKGVVLVAVAVAPWLPVLFVVAIPVWWTVRRSRRRSRGSAAVH